MKSRSGETEAISRTVLIFAGRFTIVGLKHAITWIWKNNMYKIAYIWLKSFGSVTLSFVKPIANDRTMFSLLPNLIYWQTPYIYTTILP